MVLKIKSIPSFERGDHVESKYIIENKFRPFQNSRKGCLNRKLTRKMTWDVIRHFKMTDIA